MTGTATHLIEEYTADDAPRVAQMWRDSVAGWPGGSWGATMTSEQVAAFVRNLANLAIFVARLGDRVVGWCNLTREWRDPRYAYIGILNVAVDVHGRGVGRDLLRAGFDRALALGYKRLDLNTWPANRRAMPLYKKMGFFWVAETSVKMQNYLPGLVRHPAVEDFLAGADWYGALRQPTAMVEDAEKIDDRPIYRYYFERDGQRLEVAIDGGAEEIAEIVTPRYRAELRAPRWVVAGATATATLRVEPVAADLALGPVALRADPALGGDGRLAAPDPGRQSLVIALSPGAPGDGQARAELVVDGRTIRLAAAIAAVAPLVVTPREPSWRAPVGELVTQWVTVENKAGRPLHAAFRAAGSDAVAVSGDRGPAEIAPGARRSFRLAVESRQPGAHPLRLEARADDHSQAAGGADVVVASPPFGGVLAYRRGDDAVLETEHARLVLARKGGGITVALAGPDRPPANVGLFLGPPYLPTRANTEKGEIDIIPGQPLPELRHILSLPDHPGVWVERRARLAPGGKLLVEATIHNGGDAPVTLTARWTVGVDDDDTAVPTVALPLADRILATASPHFPRLPDGVFAPADFAEPWAAREENGRVVAARWGRADSLAWDAWRGLNLEQAGTAISPGARWSPDPLEVWVGWGDWRAARAQWFPTPSTLPVVESPVRATVSPRVVVLDSDAVQIEVVLASDRLRVAAPALQLEAIGGVSAATSTPRLKPVGLGRDVTGRVAIERGVDGAGLDEVALRARTNVDEALARVPVIRLARAAAGVAVEEHSEGGRATVAINNGWMRLRIAPDFAGGVISWVRDGVEHLHSGYPDVGMYTWFNPWHGGIHPGVGKADAHTLSAIADSLDWQRIGAERFGATWSGIRLAGAARALPWLRVEVDYLTLPGASLFLTILRLTNAGDAFETLRAGYNAFVRPAGTGPGALSHWSDDRVPFVPEPYQMDYIPGGRAIAVEGEGATIALACPTPTAHAGALAIGESGTDLFVESAPTLEPGQIREIVAYFGLATTPDEGRRYRLLASPFP